MRIGTLKTGWNFFSQNFETFAGSLKRWKGEKKIKTKAGLTRSFKN
jgi:hypothetical protein